MESAVSVFNPIAQFSFSLPAGNALRKNKSVQSCITCRRRKTKCDRQWPCTPCKNRGEADTCEPYVREPTNRPTGYTHVSDTSILANRVNQLEVALSRLIARVDNVGAYGDIINEFKDPLPVFRPNRDGEDDMNEKQEPMDQDMSVVDVSMSSLNNGAGNGSRDDERGRKDREPRGGAVSASRSTRRVTEPSPGPALLNAAHEVSVGPSSQPHGGHHFPHAAAAHAHSGSIGALTGAGQGPAPVGTMPPADLVSPAHILASIASCPPSFDTPDPSAHAHLPLDMGYGVAPAAANAPWPPPHAQHLPSNFGMYAEGRSEPASKVPSIQEHNATLELEAMALGRGAQWGERSPEKDNDGPTLSSIIHIRPRPDHDHLKEFPQVANLPNVLIGKYVLTHYLDNIDHNWRCFHRPTFENQCSELFSRIRARATEFTLGELATLGLYAACLSVSLLYLDDDSLNDLGLTNDQSQILATKCWKVAYAALDESDWMQVHDIRGIQTLIVGGLYLSSVKRANQHWAMLGTATKVAMAIGLATIPDESKIATTNINSIPPRFRSAIDREVGRRIWFCLCEYDILFTMENGFMYIINPELSTTSEPANINDVDIHPDVPVVSLPIDTYTDMSHHLARAKLMYLHRNLMTKVRKAGRMRYQFVTEAHAELLQCIEERPLFFRDTDTIVAQDAVQLHKIKREACLLREATDLRMVRLHRYYFPESCHNPRYLKTKQSCLAAARRMLSAEQRYRMFSSNYPHFWAHNYMVFTATMVAIIYLIYAEPEEVEDIKSLSEHGIEQLRSLSTRGRLDLNDTADTLTVLMENQLRRRDAESPSKSLKRNFGDFLYENWGNGAGWVPELPLEGGKRPYTTDPGSAGMDTGSTSAYTDVNDMGFVFDSLLNDYAMNVG